jgi:hypothetical protein
MAKPTSKFTWATDGGAEISEPAAGSKATGFRATYSMPSHWINWLINVVGAWLTWLDTVVTDGSSAARLGTHGVDSTATVSGESGVNGTGSGDGIGVSGTGGATGAGVYGTGGATSGAGGTFLAQNGNSNGIGTTGNGSGAGISSTGGATGHGGAFYNASGQSTLVATGNGANLKLVARSGDPSSPVDGDVWFDGAALHIRISGVTKHFTVS